jgi:hypothetical protein
LRAIGASIIHLHFTDGHRLMMRRKVFGSLLCLALSAGCAASEQPTRPPGPVVRVHFDYYPKDRARIRVLEHRLASAIKDAHVGELGETEFHVDGNDGYLYMYGPDADRLYAATSSILKSSKLMTDAEVTKHYGARTETFVINRNAMR